MTNTDTSPDEAESVKPHLDIAFALEAAGLGVWEIDSRTRQIKLDDSCRALMGLPRANGFTYQQALSRVHPDDVDRVVQAVQEAMNPASGGRYVLTHRTVGAEDGLLRWVRFMGRSYFTETGELYQFAGVAQDVTKQVQDQQHQEQFDRQLTESQQRFQTIIAHSPVAFALFRGPQFVIELANDRVLDFWGRTRDEVMNKPLFDALPEVIGQGFEEILTRVYTTGERFVAKELTVTLARKGQLEQTYIDFVYEPFREPDPNADAGTRPITGITVVCVEVTEQVLARKALQDEQNRLNTILTQMPVGVLIANPNGQLIYSNRQVEQIFREPFRESHDIESYTNWPLFDPATDKPFRLEAMPMVRALRHGETVTGVEMKLRRGDNTWGYISANAVPVYNSAGQLQYGVSAFVDITGRRETEEALRESEEKYRTVFNSIDQGYYLADVVFDEKNQAIDIFYSDANPAATRMTGQDFKGKRLREIDPTYESYWYEIFGRVAKTGQAERLQQYADPDQKWYDFYVFKIGQVGSRVAVIFQDITERKRREANQTFLADIAEAFALGSSIDDIMQNVGAKIGAHMNVVSCIFTDVDETKEKQLTVSHGWTHTGVLPIVGNSYRMADYVTPELERAMHAGETVVVNDTQTDLRINAVGYANGRIGSFLVVPFHHDGKWRHYMTIYDTWARDWRNDEIELFRKLANRIFFRLDRARTEESLHRQEERTRIAIEAADMGTWEWNLLTDEVYWNEQHFWLFGMEPHAQPLTSDEFTQHVHPDDRDRIKAELERTIREKIVYDADFRAIRNDGTIRWMSGYGRVTAEVDGQSTRLSGVMIDIDDRKRTDEALRQSEEQLRIVMESITDHALITTDTRRMITGWNSGAQNLFGFTAEEAIGQPEDILFTFEDRAAGVPEQEMETARQQGRAADERYHTRKDGSRFYVSGVQSPIYHGNGTLLGYVKVARNLTERRQMEQALHEADRRKDEFLATLAHELRNPLAPIRNALQVLTLTTDGNEMVTSAVAMMSRQVDQLVRLIDDLLDVSRISRGMVQLRLERINLGDVVRQAVEATRSLFLAGRQELTVALPEIPLYVQADPTRLIQVVSNLLNNAAKFNHNGGRVWLTLELAREESEPLRRTDQLAQPGRYMALLRVRDNGIGIATEQLERIFDLFAQTDTTLERSQGGLGLGLTLVRQLVELHGGWVEAHSKGLGKGSEFTVYLPVMTETHSPQPAANTGTKPLTTGRRILVVDDNPDAATTLAMLLKLKGHQVDTRYSGQAGIAAAESGQPEVILLDIGMPGLNGYDTARLIRAQPWSQSMVLIALTGYGQEEDRRLSQEAGFDAHLVKPLDIDALTQLLSTLPAQSGHTEH